MLNARAASSELPRRGRRPGGPVAFLLVALLAGVPGLPGTTDADDATMSPARARYLQALRDTGRVSEALLAVWETEDRAPVMITLEVPRRSRMARRARRERIRERADQALADAPAHDFRLRHRFRHAAGMAGELHLRAARRLLANPAVRELDLDGGGRGMLSQSMPIVGGYTASTAGFTGSGVTVAVLDSGIDTDHPDLAAALIDEHCICRGGGNTNCCPNGQSTQTGVGSAEDDNGHGSLVAGVLLSRGNVASIGMAPAAQLVAVKVLDEDLIFANTSDVIDALQWVIDNYTAEPPAVSTVRVVNLSLATGARFRPNPPCGDLGGTVGMFGDVVDELESRGVLVVAAAGNISDDVQLPAPACLTNVISVGATWDADLGGVTSEFGCVETTTAPDQVTCFTNAPAHTNIFAPGARITGPNLEGVLGVSEGTSFASPAVAGCGALLLEQDDLRTPADLTSLMLASPTTITDPGTGFSFPRLDCADALGLGPGDDDSDFDGITVDDGDNCPTVANALQGDVEAIAGDGIGDRCDVCVFVEDPDQTDTDMDGLGDACECTGPDLWPGDVDGNGVVDDQSDLFILEFNFGDTGVTPSQGDQNCDDSVDGADYTLWADNFGRDASEADLP